MGLTIFFLLVLGWGLGRRTEEKMTAGVSLFVAGVIVMQIVG
jgi:hypothetical protein